MGKNTQKDVSDNSQKHSRELRSILELNKKLHERYSVDGVIESSIEEIHKSLSPDLILFYVRHNKALKLKASKYYGTDNRSDYSFQNNNTYCLFNISADTGNPVFSNVLGEDPRCACEQCKHSAFSSMASLPLMSKDGVIGVLGLMSLSERDFSPARSYLETASNAIAVRVENVLSIQRLKNKISTLEARNDGLLRRENTQEKESLLNMETLQLLFDGIPNPIMLLDNKLRIKMINQAARKHYRVPSEFQPDNISCHELFWNRLTPCNGCEVTSNLHCTSPVTFERKSVLKPDSTIKVTLIPLTTSSLDTTQYIEFISDISKEKYIEQELQQADKMISLGILVSGVAHEINNPNNWTMINAPILSEIWKGILPILNTYYERNGDFNASGLPYIEMRDAVPRLLDGILEGSKRIKTIVQELKNYSRPDPGDKRAPLDITGTLKSAVKLVAKQIEKSTDNFSVTYSDNIPMIQGNNQKLEQVVVNLLINACQSLPDRRCGISLSTFFDIHSDNVVVSVCDEGIGIPEAVIPRIMDPFFTTKRHKGGTGLGLSVSSKIIQDHGGQLKVTSKPGKGSTFTVLLPIEQRVQKTRVLVADDDEMVRDIVAQSLHGTHRYYVKKAANGIETCLMLGIETPDVIILDINMPDMDGVEVCRQIQKTPLLKDLKVIIISGDHQSEKARVIEEMGFGNILPKPFSINSIVDMVESVIRVPETISETER